MKQGMIPNPNGIPAITGRMNPLDIPLIECAGKTKDTKDTAEPTPLWLCLACPSLRTVTDPLLLRIATSRRPTESSTSNLQLESVYIFKDLGEIGKKTSGVYPEFFYFYFI